MLNKLLHLSYVQRWIICDMLRPQSVAEHSFRVAVIAIHLIEGNRSVDVATVLHRAIYHDVDEVESGDIPSTYKPTKPISPVKAEAVVQVADVIEALDWMKKHGNPANTHRRNVVQFLELKLGRRVQEFEEKFGGNWIASAVGRIINEMGE